MLCPFPTSGLPFFHLPPGTPMRSRSFKKSPPLFCLPFISTFYLRISTNTSPSPPPPPPFYVTLNFSLITSLVWIPPPTPAHVSSLPPPICSRVPLLLYRSSRSKRTHLLFPFPPSYGIMKSQFHFRITYHFFFLKLSWLTSRNPQPSRPTPLPPLHFQFYATSLNCKNKKEFLRRTSNHHHPFSPPFLSSSLPI